MPLCILYRSTAHIKGIINPPSTVSKESRPELCADFRSKYIFHTVLNGGYEKDYSWGGFLQLLVGLQEQRSVFCFLKNSLGGVSFFKYLI